MFQFRAMRSGSFNCGRGPAVYIALIAWALVCFGAISFGAGQAYATYADYDTENPAQQDLGTFGDPIYPQDIPDGVYEVNARTSSRMCIMYRNEDDAASNSNKELCTISVQDGTITSVFYISKMYTRLCLGNTAEEAAALTNDDGTDDSAYLRGDPADGYVPHLFTMQIPALNHPIECAAFAGGNYPYDASPSSGWNTRAKWYSRTVVFTPTPELTRAIEAAKNGGEDDKGGGEGDEGGDGNKGDSADGDSSTETRKIANPLAVTVKQDTLSFVRDEAPSLSILLKDVLDVTGAQGEVTYEKASGAAGIAVSSDGILRLDKSQAFGSYPVVITVSAAGNEKYESGGEDVHLTVEVKKARSFIDLEEQFATFTGKPLAYSGVETRYGSSGAVTHRYYRDAACTQEVPASAVVDAGVYYVQATLAADADHEAATGVTRFTINPKPVTPKFALAKSSYAYDGKAKKPAVTVKVGSAKLTQGVDYEVTYAKGRKNVGDYTVKVSRKGGNYEFEDKTLTFTIKPKGTTLASVTGASKGFTAKWKKQAKQATGYQVEYALNAKFKNAKTISVSKVKTVSKTVKKLKAKKRYYVRVRTYKKVGNTAYYSAWSPVKTVTTKK